MVSEIGEEKFENDLEGVIEMLDELTVEQIRSMPEYMVDIIKNILPMLPLEIVSKLNRAWK
jgi:hypothetical protein